MIRKRCVPAFAMVDAQLSRAIVRRCRPIYQTAPVREPPLFETVDRTRDVFRGWLTVYPLSDAPRFDPIPHDGLSYVTRAVSSGAMRAAAARWIASRERIFTGSNRPAASRSTITWRRIPDPSLPGHPPCGRRPRQRVEMRNAWTTEARTSPDLTGGEAPSVCRRRSARAQNRSRWCRRRRRCRRSRRWRDRSSFRRG